MSTGSRPSILKATTEVRRAACIWSVDPDAGDVGERLKRPGGQFACVLPDPIHRALDRFPRERRGRSKEDRMVRIECEIDQQAQRLGRDWGPVRAFVRRRVRTIARPMI
jgi:hypothetical protein